MSAAVRVGGREERLTETQERFLRAAAARLPLERVVELHLFPAMRQGGTETGFAVIAARRQTAAQAEPVEALEAVETATAAESAASTRSAESGESIDPADAGGAPPQAEDAQLPPPASHLPIADDIDPAPGAAASGADVSDVSDAGTTGASDAPDERLVVFSARYRLTLKGPDRGRWEVEVVEEADAPLVTVDAVVRGMQRRIGEGAEPERLTADQLHALLDDPSVGPPAR